MSKPAKNVAIQIPSTAESRRINKAARADSDAQPLSQSQLNAMVSARALRGRPPSATKKQLVSVRYSPEVIDYFRSTGDGWQSRMDSVLRRYVQAQARRTATPVTQRGPTNPGRRLPQ